MEIKRLSSYQREVAVGLNREGGNTGCDREMKSRADLEEGW